MNERLDKKGAMQLFCICWLIYFCSYLGRLNYSSVMNELIGTVMTKAQAGWVNTAFLVAYAAGQLINGMLAEKVSPRWFAAAGDGFLHVDALAVAAFCDGQMDAA